MSTDHCDRCGIELDPEDGEPHKLATGPDDWDEVCADCIDDRPEPGTSLQTILTRRRL